jgi:hypothetical protein
MTSVFEDSGRTNPAQPQPLVPRAATQGDPASDEDGPGVDFSFMLQLGASLGSMAESMQADRDRRDSFAPPGDEQLNADGLVPSSGVLILDLGSVPQGRVWQVRRVVTGGPQATDTPDGAAFVYRQGARPTDLNTTNVVDSFPSFSTGSQGSTYGTHQLFLRGGEHLYIVTSGATEGDQWVASAQVEDWEDSSFQSTFAE